MVREGAFCVKPGAQLWRTDGWAYLRYDEGGAELYDMRADPRQFTNLAGERPDLVTAMDAALEAKLESLEPR